MLPVVMLKSSSSSQSSIPCSSSGNHSRRLFQKALRPSSAARCCTQCHSLLPSKSPQSKSKSKSFIPKKARHPYFVRNMKKLGETIDADFDVFKVRCTVCKEERITTAGFARVNRRLRSSKNLQCTIVHYDRGKFNPLPGVNSQAQMGTFLKQPLCDFKKTSAHIHEKVGDGI